MTKTCCCCKYIAGYIIWLLKNAGITNTMQVNLHLMIKRVGIVNIKQVWSNSFNIDGIVNIMLIRAKYDVIIDFYHYHAIMIDKIDFYHYHAGYGR